MTAGQLRARLGEALDLASSGERIIVKRDHRAIAAIVPIEDAQQLEGHGAEALARRRAALRRIRERAERLRPDSPTTSAAAMIRDERERDRRERP